MNLNLDIFYWRQRKYLTGAQPRYMESIARVLSPEYQLLVIFIHFYDFDCFGNENLGLEGLEEKAKVALNLLNSGIK